jgi:hypothetical protein
MKQVTLTPKEFYVFRELATFFFDLVINKGSVTVVAEQSHLENLGY